MNYDEYKKYVIETVIETYPKYVQEDLINILIDKKIIIEGKNQLVGQTNLEGLLDVGEFEEEKRLVKSLELRRESIKVLEEWEFAKSYKYSALFSYDNLDMKKLELLIKNNEANYFSNLVETFDRVSESVVYPTIYEYNNQLFFKFNLAKRAIEPLSGRRRLIKYPILAVFHKDINTLEIRLDSINNIFKNGNSFYSNLINQTKSWLSSRLDVELYNINFRPIIEFILECKSDEVKVSSQMMSMQCGGTATLDVGKNEDYILPLLGELKRLINTNKQLFDKSIEIRDLLENFILEIEETSDLPWITLCWKSDKKSNDVCVKFIHEYMGEEYSLLQHLGKQKDFRRMDYVARYLVKNKKMVD